MPYRYKVRLAGKTEKKEKSLLAEALERLALKFRSSMHRAILRDFFLEHDPSLTDVMPEIKLKRSTPRQTIFDMIRSRIDEPMEFSFFGNERPLLPLRRSFAAALVFAVTFAGFVGFTSKSAQAAEQPHNNQQRQAVKGSLEFLPTDCPPIMNLSNCVNASTVRIERSMGLDLLAQTYPGSVPTHSNTSHSDTAPHTNTTSPHGNNPASDTHTNTSHVNLAPGDTIF